MPKLERIPEAHVYRAYGVYLMRSQHRLIRRLKKVYTPSVHGHKTWNASFLLMDYLEERPIGRGSRVLEVGCGWGPGSVFCASRFGADVTAIDIDEEVFPFMDVLAALNDVTVASKVTRFEKLNDEYLANFDTLIASDICFWDSLVKPLRGLIKRALSAGVQRVIITDPGRPTFYELCDALAKKHYVELSEWYATQPKYFEGEVVEVRAAAD